MKFLIVDDSAIMRKIVLRTLRQAGFTDHEFFEAENGIEGLKQYAAESPDLIISDWNMPEMTGIEFLRELRTKDTKLPFGFITTEGTPDMRRLAIETGANFLVEKPFTAEQLETVISEYVK